MQKPAQITVVFEGTLSPDPDIPFSEELQLAPF
jgi:hypothetical protein